ncbi:MAG: 50S ribosomal protein L24 [Chloroflexota bacterium]
MQKIRKGDTVEVIAGKDVGERGTVLTVYPKKQRLVVENINMARKHQKERPGPGGQNLPAQILDFPAPMDWSNVMLVCPSCDQRTRVGIRFEDDRKVRHCKKCDSTID